jgi:hypothetical protein
MKDNTSNPISVIEEREKDTLKEIANVLSEILKRAPALTEEDKGFVRARASYLTDKQAKVLLPIVNPVEGELTDTPVQPKTKKTN